MSFQSVTRIASAITMKDGLTCYAMSAMLVASPLFFPRQGRRYAMVPVAVGVLGLISRLVAEIEVRIEETRTFHPSHELSEAVESL
jgi:hypothetical protein